MAKMHRCLIPNCKMKTEYCSVFQLPKQIEMREKWMKAILDEYPELEIKTNDKFFVCEKHFHRTDFYTFRNFDYVSAYIVDRSNGQKISAIKKRLNKDAVPRFGDLNLDSDKKPLTIKQEEPIATLNNHPFKIRINESYRFKPPKGKVKKDPHPEDDLFFVRRTMPVGTANVKRKKEPNVSKKAAEAELHAGHDKCSSMSLDPVQIKEEKQEPNVKQEQSCGISEEAAKAEMYTRHVVKHNEIAVESVHIKQEPEEPILKEEPLSSLSEEAAADMYAGDVVNRNSMLIEPVPIKEEPNMEEDGFYGVSEEAAEANLYTGYVVKRNTMSIESGHINEEEPIVQQLSGMSEEAAEADLYAGHVVKRELVLGPELLQVPDIAFRVHEPAAGPINKTESVIDKGPEESMRNNLGYDVNRWGQFAIKACSVRLQRILVDQKPHIFKTNLKTSPQKQFPVSDQHCNTETLERNFIPKSWKIGTEQPTKTFDCEVCGKHFVLRHYLSNHYRRVHKRVAQVEKKSHVNTPHSSEIDKESTYAVCYMPSLLPHQKSQSSSKTFSCETCKKTFTSKTYLIEHFRNHTGEKPYQCDICKKSFPGKRKLANHILTHAQSGQKSYQCDMCEKSFVRKCRLYSHKLIHTNIPYTCAICNEQFTAHKLFTKHIREHLGQKVHTCDVCGKGFAWKGNLITHSRIHSNEKPYKCDICAMTFKDLSCFNRHKLIHTKEKPHSCEVCDKTFAHRSTLIVHKRMHTGERPYKCDICNKMLSCKTALVKHTRVHTGEKRFSCSICQKAFAERNKLVLHTRIHTGEKPLMCNICNKSFARTHSLTTHKCIKDIR